MLDNLKILLIQHNEQLNEMSDEDRLIIAAILDHVTRKQAQYDNLDRFLDRDLSLEDLNLTHSNLSVIRKEINASIDQCKKIISNCKPSEQEDQIDEIKKKALSLSRQGSVAIRPTGKGAYPVARTRKK